MQNTDKKTNRLINETSPYLLQHAYNPVNWYPWGKEAIDTARAEDKPVLVSIGYSTCHWCHVMEKESFEDPDVARIMNENFICIKIDREERPDLDTVYITAVSAITGSGGWPLNAFLTPDELKPFYGGTYFPKESGLGRPGWTDLLLNISGLWQNKSKREEIRESSRKITSAIETYLAASNQSGHGSIDSNAIFQSALEHFADIFDKEHGGFGGAPKFPSPSNQDFLLLAGAGNSSLNSATDRDKALATALFTLNKIASGGIFDHIGGGFHRYATDEKWHVPHFEKMLYDNAQLTESYIEAFNITKDSRFLETAKKTIDYVLRDMTHPDGGFFSAEDADSYAADDGDEKNKKEGAFYVWRADEIESLLDKDTADILFYHYGIKQNGNVVADPAGEFKGVNILYRAHTLAETAENFQLSETKAGAMLDKAEKALFENRKTRTRPHLDDKIITSWNGLMISALAVAYRATEEKQYLSAAQKVASFIQQNLYDKDKGGLYRIWKNGDKKIIGLASDYAFFIKGLLDIYEADKDEKWLQLATTLTDDMIELFYDSQNGGFFMTRADHDENLIIRVKDNNDSVLPSASAIAAANMIRLADISQRNDFSKAAQKTIASVLNDPKKDPAASPKMLIALGKLQNLTAS